jgi:hypothetical protein
MGCRYRMASGISWVFEKEECAILLEDDCLPSNSFFDFCTSMLLRYRNDPRIMQVCGTNRMNYRPRTGDHYFFSHYAPIWGWATWRRAWQLHDYKLSDWEEHRWDLPRANAYPASVYQIREAQLDSIVNGTLDTWDFAWMYTLMKHNGLAVIPARNLIRNIGMGIGATHTLTPFTRASLLRRVEMPPPYSTPTEVKPSDEHDRHYCERFFNNTMLHVMRSLKAFMGTAWLKSKLT